MNNKVNIFSNQIGQTLLEILFAFSAVILVLSAIVLGVTTSLNNAQYTKNQSLANSFAQEGMSVVKKMRDSEGNDFFDRTGTYCLGSDITKSFVEANPLSLCKQDQYMIGVNSGSNQKIFAREIVFEKNSMNCCSDGSCTSGMKGSKVIVTVTWSDNKCPIGTPYCHKVELITCFSNVNQRQIP